MAAFSEWLGGSRVFGAVMPQWFNPTLDSVDGRIVSAEATTGNYHDGSPPWNVRLRRLSIDHFGNLEASTSIATYTVRSSSSFSYGSRHVAENVNLFYWTAARGTSKTAVDLKAVLLDDDGNVIKPAFNLAPNLSNPLQLSATAAATFGSGVTITYGSYDAATNTETITYKTFSTRGAATASGTLYSFQPTGAARYIPYSFGSFDPSTSPNPSYLFGATYTHDGGATNLLRFQVINTDFTERGAAFEVATHTPQGSTGQAVLNGTWGRLTPAGSGNDFVAVFTEGYRDSRGVVRYALDVHTMNTSTGAGVDDVLALPANSSVIETRLPDGGFVIGYQKGGTEYLRHYNNAGHAVGASTAIAGPLGSNYKVSGLGDGRVLLEWRSNAEGGNQVNYDIYDTRTTALKYMGTSGNDSVAGTVLGDVFTTGGGHDTFYGAAGNDVFKVDSAPTLIDGGAGTDTVQVTAAVVFGANSVANVEAFKVSAGASIDLSALTTGAKVTSLSTATRASAVVGTAGKDTIAGGVGKDTITGGLGADTLGGAGGADTFVFRTLNDTPTSGSDRITDFSGTDGDALLFQGFGAGTRLTFVENAAGTLGTLKVIDGSDVARVFLDGAFEAGGFHVARDKAGTGSVITYTAPDRTAFALAPVHA